VAAFRTFPVIVDQEESMAAYMIAEIEVKDPARYEEYRRGVQATIDRYGGRFLARGGAAELVEGSGEPKRVVILEFPTMAQLKQWYDSPEYVPLRELRQSASEGRFVVVQGV
jgi:uncharacterized protein (DUF1330 family)